MDHTVGTCLTFLKNAKRLSQVLLAIMFPLAAVESSDFFGLLNCAHSRGYTGEPHSGFGSYFPADVEHIFVGVIAICRSSLMK